MARVTQREIYHHPLHRRALFSFVLVAAVLAFGTIGFHLLEHYSYVNSFYFVSMLATAEGPATTPVTAVGKIFASFIAFVSVGSVIFALAYIFGPFIARVAGVSERKLKKEERIISKDVRKVERRI
jgi:voltage-gated potassium channel